MGGISFPLPASGAADCRQRDANTVSQPLSEDAALQASRSCSGSSGLF
jgi:hypothetical protein